MPKALRKYFLQSICYKVKAVSDITGKGQLQRYVSEKSHPKSVFFLKKETFFIILRSAASDNQMLIRPKLGHVLETTDKMYT